MLDTGKIYIALFVKEDHGQAIFKFSVNKSTPRKNEFLLAILPGKVDVKYKAWKDISYKQLIKNAVGTSQANCIWLSATKDGKYILAGFRGISVEFANKLAPNTPVFFGEDAPPVEYLSNLSKIINSGPSTPFSVKLLSPVNSATPTTLPELLPDDQKITSFISKQLIANNIIIIQGPPGTGKTTTMAEFCAEQLKRNKSVLVTALTNRALLELVKKDSLANYRSVGKVLKHGLTIDEAEQLPELLHTSNIVCAKGVLCLSTFYKVSGFAEQISNTLFDYVIMDEASQAFLATFIALLRIGKKQIWIGDCNQLPPIIQLNDDVVKQLEATTAIYGLQTICNLNLYPYYQLNNTYRLTQRAADFTSVFYNNYLHSKSDVKIPIQYDQLPQDFSPLFNPAGGPSWLQLKLRIGEKAPQSGLINVLSLVNSIKDIEYKGEKVNIALLSFYVKTIKDLQKGFNQISGNTNNVSIDTISRIQGSECDICIFFIPNTGYIFSLEKALFNVATSRSSFHTIIISDANVLNFEYLDRDVRKFLLKLEPVVKKDKQFYISPPGK